MTFRISIRAGAARDIEVAREWYEGEREGLGSAFLDEVEAALERIGERPGGYAIAHGDARRALVRRFPYTIYFRIRGDQVRILAVIHQARDPRVWQRRVRERG
ncbi:MAG: type II toxin-antitoxin system RelE/ParE family toxin [Hyphomicrobiaceae bacterium]|nr:type II toxin-antitoxin system RelE/ParE family toxin [Hyphomicrobiaceae bacterium]